MVTRCDIITWHSVLTLPAGRRIPTHGPVVLETSPPGWDKRGRAVRSRSWPGIAPARLSGGSSA
jgi:hypothetical protein